MAETTPWIAVARRLLEEWIDTPHQQPLDHSTRRLIGELLRTVPRRAAHDDKKKLASSDV